MSLPQ